VIAAAKNNYPLGDIKRAAEAFGGDCFVFSHCNACDTAKKVGRRCKDLELYKKALAAETHEEFIKAYADWCEQCGIDLAPAS
jgi:hypothetical protein